MPSRLAIPAHEITAPAFDAKTKLHRERLVDALHGNVPRKLIVVAAPPGYGKTTLLADFYAHTELPVCWVAINEADRDAARFAAVVSASIQKRFRRLRGKLELAAYGPVGDEQYAGLIAHAIEENIAEPFLIILDDIHLVNSSGKAMRFIDGLLEHLPDQVTIIAAGREVPDISLAKLMADGELAGLGPHDLMLTREELIELGQRLSGERLTVDDADQLLEDTRGWITGVLLSSTLLGDRLKAIVSESRPMVYEYLAAVVLNRQPDDLRRFMFDSSVLPVMTAAACDQIRDKSDSQKYLSRLVREGLFITATEDSPRTYEFHPQFRQFLLESLEKSDPGRARKLQMRAGNYFARNGSPETAFELYVHADSIAKAAAIAERNSAQMLSLGRTQTLERWAELLAAKGSGAPLGVLLHLATAYIDRGDLEWAEGLLSGIAERLSPKTPKKIQAEIELRMAFLRLGQGENRAALGHAEKAEQVIANRASKFQRGSIYRVKALSCFRERDNLPLAEKLALSAIATLEKSDAKYAYAISFLDLSMIRTALGKSDEAHADGLRAAELLEGIGAIYPLSSALNNLAIDAHLQGNFEEALKLFEEALKRARQAANPKRESIVLFGQADLFSDLDLALQAAELYGQGLAIATRIDDRSLVEYGCVQTSVLHRRRGGAGLANEWLKRALAIRSGKASTPPIEIQMAALECAAAPRNAIARLQTALDQGGLDASERTQALFFLSKAQHTSRAFEQAERCMSDCLAWAGARGMEQIVAAEFAFDGKIFEFARRMLSRNPVLSIIIQRLDAMRSITAQYREPVQTEATPRGITMRTLGEAAVLVAGVQHAELKPLSREVLCYIADHQQVDRDVLIEAFWPHHPSGRQTANLHMAIYNLRRCLGKDIILLEGSNYRLNPDIPLEVDVARFERAATVANGLPAGDPRRFFALTEAINAYTGPFLPEFASEWVVERRRDLEMRYLDLLTDHATEALVRDQPLRAVSTLRRALEIDPYRDSINVYYIEALGRLGRRGELVDHYQRYIRMLRDELGLDPSERIRTEYVRWIS
jgi:LuxR family maltose regulon positive regulatory protein